MREQQRQLFSTANRVLLLIALLMPGTSLLAQKITIAVLDFEGRGISQTEVAALSDRLRNELFRLDVFQVVERGMMETILTEQDFQLVGCTSNECLVEVGQLLGAQMMVGGSISKVGDMYTASARIVDVETSQVIMVADYDLEGRINDMLTIGMRALALKLARSEKATPPTIEKAPPPSDKEQQVQRKTLDLGSGVTMEFVWVPAGDFMMGSNTGRENERPRHQVVLSKGFWISERVVLGPQWKQLGGQATRYVPEVIGKVEWKQAVLFCEELQKRVTSDFRVRLPTEAEWEYAGSLNVLKYEDESVIRMEWCQDACTRKVYKQRSPFYYDGARDPVGLEGSYRVLRYPGSLTKRGGTNYWYAFEDCGFRVVLVP